MTKASHKGIPALQQATPFEIKEFCSKIFELGYRKLETEQKLVQILDKNLHKPKRANSENALQDQYIYKSKTGLTVHIHTAMIGDDFSDKGSAWVLVLDEENQSLFTREFYKNYSSSLLRRLYAYAELLKFIVDQRPAGTRLEEVCTMTFIWRPLGQHQDNPKPIIWKDKISEHSRKIIATKEKKRKRYFIKSEGKVNFRERDKRSTWKK